MALAAMMLVTVADVVLRAAANLPIRGTLEIVELLLACTFFLALPASFLRDEHIVVDIVDAWAPRRVALLRRIAGVLGVVLLALMAWQGWIAARDTLAFNDVTSDLALPRIWYWVPVLAGMIGAGLAAAAMLFQGKNAK
jgi:TRAP-type C4-dicarboxylate transport system permease small subunit